MVSPIKTPAFWSVACPIRRRFKVFSRSLQKIYGVDLPFFSPLYGRLPDQTLSSFKSFLSAMVEGRSNIWDDALSRQKSSACTRASIGHSLFLFRKLIPGDPPPLDVLFNKVTSPSPEPDQKFMDFIRREVPRLLPRGWDRHYSQACIDTVVSTRSCYENGVSSGGSRSLLVDPLSPEDSRMEFVESVLTANGSPPTVRSRLTCVMSGGKWRPLSIPSVELNKLRPLHHSLYDYLARYKWLLRGDAKPGRFSDFSTVDGELFVSGDYESATDNLNQSVQKEILRLVLQNAVSVPNGISLLAMKSLSLDLADPSDPNQMRFVQQKSGQMMGNLLSFPLLCLVNYLTFRYLVPESGVPVRINGDDIVFRASPEIAGRWMRGVEISGLVLSRGKTLLNRRFFSLNSSLFRSGGRKVALVPFIRSKALFGVGSDDLPIGSLSGRFSSFCPGFFGRRRTLLRSFFLRENSGWIRKSCRSLSRGLGFSIRSAELKESGLWSRELRYLELPGEGKPVPTFSSWARSPVGFELSWVDRKYKSPPEVRDVRKAAFIEASWMPPREVTQGKYIETWMCGLDLSDRTFLRKAHRYNQKSRLLKVSHAQAKSFLRMDDSLWDRRPNRCHRLEWLPIGRPIVFSGGPVEHETSYPWATVIRDVARECIIPERVGKLQPSLLSEGDCKDITTRWRLYPPPSVY